MKTKFINGVSSSPSMSLGLLVNENALQVHPDADEHCKELLRQDQADLETRRKAFMWCREFLHGNWKTVSEDDFRVTVIRYISSFLCVLEEGQRGWSDKAAMTTPSLKLETSSVCTEMLRRRGSQLAVKRENVFFPNFVLDKKENI